mmetsp:Transcript_24566/g.92828  ORF Transcript_24566/g.92828 Transcript_24566/m.92828 type:complete len:225 (+) Transcript_24566:4528-5202(+)
MQRHRSPPKPEPGRSLTARSRQCAPPWLGFGQQDGDALLQVSVVSDSMPQVSRPTRDLLGRGLELTSCPNQAHGARRDARLAVDKHRLASRINLFNGGSAPLRRPDWTVLLTRGVHIGKHGGLGRPKVRSSARPEGPKARAVQRGGLRRGRRHRVAQKAPSHSPARVSALCRGAAGSPSDGAHCQRGPASQVVVAHGPHGGGLERGHRVPCVACSHTGGTFRRA